jgi:hypothetical protein
MKPGWIFVLCLVILGAVVVIVLGIVAPNVYRCGKLQCCPFPNQTGKDCTTCLTGYQGANCMECAEGYMPEQPMGMRRRMMRRMFNAPLPVPQKCVKACPFPGQTGNDCTSCRKPGYETKPGETVKCTSCEQGFEHVGPEPAPGEPDARPCEAPPAEITPV